jgi:hypothetical protein
MMINITVKQCLLRTVSISTVLFLPLLGMQQAVAQETSGLQQLVREIAQLQAEVENLEAIEEIENLQRTFGFYIDKNLWTQAADLFAENGSIEIGGEGVYQGKARVLAYLQTKGAEGPQEGILNDHMQLMPVIDVYADGTAKGRWHHFSQEAVHGVSHHLGSGIYENDYVFEDGVWKLKNIHLFTTMRTSYDDGWHVSAEPRTKPSTVLPPDGAPTMEYENYPAVFVPPFHYENPVSGVQPVLSPSVSVLSEVLDVANAEAAMAGLGKRVGRLSDAEAVESLQTVYGYYLAHNQWDDLTGIFAEDGTIEIAQRGVYKGKASVRRNLDLYGVQDQLPGQLHNHMQYQPVIHISEDGQTALLRSRAFSMMGNFGQDGRWMGGTYENIYVKRDGVWQILKDQQLNTYFASVDQGWKDLVWRPAPGITDANPPDAPPSTYFEMYPRAYLPAFHYVNPVSGREVTAPVAQE